LHTSTLHSRFCQLITWPEQLGGEALVVAQMDSVDPSAVLGWTFGILLIAVAAWHTFSGVRRPLQQRLERLLCGCVHVQRFAA